MPVPRDRVLVLLPPKDREELPPNDELPLQTSTRPCQLYAKAMLDRQHSALVSTASLQVGCLQDNWQRKTL